MLKEVVLFIYNIDIDYKQVRKINKSILYPLAYLRIYTVYKEKTFFSSFRLAFSFSKNVFNFQYK